MLMKSLELLIRLGRTDGLREKIDTLWALGSLTDDQYYHLLEELEEM